MAQSRLNKAASIFTRLNGLVKSGLIPWNERPLWYDVYKTFPPDRDPSYRSVLGHDEIPQLPPKLFYPEDELRAFIQEYVELAKKGISEENLIEAAIESMNKKGHMIKKRVSKSSAELNDSEQTDNLNLGDEIKNVLANLNANQVIETKPDEHDKNTSTSIASTTNPNSQNNDSTSSSDKNQN